MRKELDPAIERARELWSGGQPKAAVELMAQRIDDLNRELLEQRSRPVPVRIALPAWFAVPLRLFVGVALLAALIVGALYAYFWLTDDAVDRQLNTFCIDVALVAPDAEAMEHSTARCSAWREMVLAQYPTPAQVCADRYSGRDETIPFASCLKDAGVPMMWDDWQ